MNLYFYSALYGALITMCRGSDCLFHELDSCYKHISSPNFFPDPVTNNHEGLVPFFLYLLIPFSFRHALSFLNETFKPCSLKTSMFSLSVI